MQIEIRRVRPSDGQALEEFYSRLSQESRRERFLGSSGVAAARAAALTFCTPDHVHEEGFVALSSQEIVGHLCLVQSGTDALELAVAVADDYQGRGIGRRLFETALAWARDQGCTRISATAFADNARALRLLSSAPHGALIEPADGGVVEVIIPLVGPLPTTRSWPPYSDGRLTPRPLRASWRRTQQPGRAAAGSASKGSS